MINNSDKINNDKFIKINKRNDENEVKLIMNEMMNNIENQILIDSLQNSKNLEFDLNNMVKKHQENIDKLNNETNINKKATDTLNEKVNNMSKLGHAGQTASGGSGGRQCV